MRKHLLLLICLSVILYCAGCVTQMHAPSDLKVQFNPQTHLLTVTAQPNLRDPAKNYINLIEVSLNGESIITQKFSAQAKKPQANDSAKPFVMPTMVTTSQAEISKHWSTQKPMIDKQLDSFPLPLSSAQKAAILASFQPKDLSAATAAALSNLKASNPDMELSSEGIMSVLQSAMKTLNPLVQQAQAATMLHQAPKKITLTTDEQKKALANFVSVESIPPAVMGYVQQGDMKEVNSFLSSIAMHALIETNPRARMVQYVIIDAQPGATITVKATSKTGGSLAKNIKI